MSRAERLALCALLGVALALRSGWFALADVDLGQSFQYDMTWYALVATMLAGGTGYVLTDGTPTAFWPPGYPAFIAAVLVGGGDLASVQMLQIVLSAATCLLTYLVGVQLFDRRSGLVAAALLATSLDHAMYAPLLLSETLFTFVVVAIALAYAKWTPESGSRVPRLRQCIALGLGVASAALIRGVALILPFALLCAWLGTSRSAKNTAACAALLLLALGAALAPWALRNRVRMGYPIVLASQLGEVLAVSHWPQATGCLPGLAADYDAVQRQQHETEKYRLRFEHLPNPAREVEAMRAETTRALAYMLSHPLEEAALVPARIRCLYHDGHSALRWGRRHEVTAPAWEWTPLVGVVWDRSVARAADLHFFALLGLAFVGMLRARSWAGAAAFVPLCVLLTTALHALVFFGDPRFHVPLLPFLCLLAAASLGRLGRGSIRGNPSNEEPIPCPT